MLTTSSWWPVYVRCNVNGENSLLNPGARHSCTWRPWVTAMYLSFGEKVMSRTFFLKLNLWSTIRLRKLATIARPSAPGETAPPCLHLPSSMVMTSRESFDKAIRAICFLVSKGRVHDVCLLHVSKLHGDVHSRTQQGRIQSLCCPQD